MQNAAETRAAPVGFENGQAIGPRVAAMDDDRFLRGAGNFQLTAENPRLHLARRMIVEIIEADLTDSEKTRMARQFFEMREMRIASRDWLRADEFRR